MTDNSFQTRKQQEVFQACEALYLRGENITIDAVGRELVAQGFKRGSNTSLSQYVQAWRNEQSDHSSFLSTLGQPRPDKLNYIIDQIRTELAKEAEDKLSAYQAEAENKMKDMLQTLSFAQEEIKQVRLHNDQLEKALTDKTHQLTAVREHLTCMEKELSDTRIQAEKNKEVAKIQIHNLENEKKTYLHELQAERELKEKFMQEHRGMINEMMDKMENSRHQAIVEIDQLKTALHHTEKLLAVSQHAHTQQQEQQQALQAQLLTESYMKQSFDLITQFIKHHQQEQMSNESRQAEFLARLNQLRENHLALKLELIQKVESMKPELEKMEKIKNIEDMLQLTHNLILSRTTIKEIVQEG